VLRGEPRHRLRGRGVGPSHRLACPPELALDGAGGHAESGPDLGVTVARDTERQRGTLPPRQRGERLEADIANAFVKLKRTTDAELDQAIEQIQRDVADRNAEFRDGLRYVFAGSTRDRWIGVALLGSGAILPGVGSVVGNLT
jgi:hypothetical protein